MQKAVETKARKIGVEKQKKEEEREEVEKKQEEKEKKKKKKKKLKEWKIEVRKVAEKCEIWNKEKEAVKSEEEVRKLVLEKLYKWIHIFDKKASEQMSTRKLWDYVINMKEGFVPSKGKVYPLLREERGELCKFIFKQVRKGYIKPSKSPQMALVFFVGKKDRKKRMVQDYQYLNKWTVKNNYSLPLILNIVENIGTEKVFMKMNL